MLMLNKGQCYKTFFRRHSQKGQIGFRMFVPSKPVRPWACTMNVIYDRKGKLQLRAITITIYAYSLTCMNVQAKAMLLE
jgi:hypothetical protein